MSDARPQPEPAETAPIHSERPTPRTVGQYTLLREIGRGGMGIVYEARQREPRRVVAVKVMSSGIGDDNAVERFRREANLLAQLQHPNIAQIFDAGIAELDGESVPYYAMEYVPGGKTLAACIRSGEFSLRQRIALVIDLCSAVQHGHDRGILHRDLKPQNVLIDADGRLRLIDFGVARALADVDSSHQTTADAMVGTLAYMSPEQVAGDAHAINARSDVYSIGVIAWELLTGTPPYDLGKLNVAQAAQIISHKAPPTLHTQDPSLDSDLDAILRRALSKERDDRYASAKALADDLEHVLRQETISIVTPSVGLRIYRQVRRQLARRPVLGFLLCTLLGASVGLLSAHSKVANLSPATFAQRGMSLAAMKMRPATLSKQVMVVGVEDAPSIATAAREAGIEGVDNSIAGRSTLRKVYARLIRQLVDARVSVIALDLTFRGSSPHDAELAEALIYAREKGVPVVAAKAGWDGEAIAPAVAAHVSQLGGVTAMLSDGHGQWTVDLAVSLPGRPFEPSLALLAAMAKLEPAPHRVEIATPPDTGKAEVLLYEPSTAPGDRRWLGQAWRFSFSRTHITAQHAAATGLPGGTEILSFPVDLPGEAERKSAFVSAAEALRSTAANLAPKVADKVVVVADFRSIGERRRTAPDGASLPSAYSQVMAIDALLGTAPVAPASWSTLLVFTLGGAALGMMLMRRSASRRKAVRLLLPAVILLSLAASVAWLYFARVQTHPVPTAVAMLAGAGFAWLLIPLKMVRPTKE